MPIFLSFFFSFLLPFFSYFPILPAPSATPKPLTPPSSKSIPPLWKPTPTTQQQLKTQTLHTFSLPPLVNYVGHFSLHLLWPHASPKGVSTLTSLRSPSWESVWRPHTTRGSSRSGIHHLCLRLLLQTCHSP